MCRHYVGMENDKEFLKKFMRARFPREREGSSYWNEWDNRLMKRDPEVFMDNETLKVFKRLKKRRLK